MPVRGYGRRYFAVSVDGAEFAEPEVADALIGAVESLFGEYGVSDIQPRLIEYDEEGRQGIARCDRGHTCEMRAALALITGIAGREAVVRVTKASGTIRSLKTKGS